MEAVRSQPQRAPDGAPIHHERYRLEATTLHRLVQQRAASLTTQTEASTGCELPRFIKDEFDAFLKCGILTHCFLRLGCSRCGHDKLLLQLQVGGLQHAMRGTPDVADRLAPGRPRPHVAARAFARHKQSPGLLCPTSLPHVPVRKWVLSLPMPLRLLLTAQSELFTPVLQVVQRAVTCHPMAGSRLKVREGHGGAVTLIHRLARLSQFTPDNAGKLLICRVRDP